jgi:hypothetical protein
MTNEIRMSNDELSSSIANSLVIRASSLFRHSSFVLRHFALPLPPKVRECPIGLRHFMRVVAFFDRVTLARRCVFEFLRQSISQF